MIYINKIIGWCFSPLGILFIGLAVGAVFRKVGSKLEKCAWMRGVGTWIIGIAVVVGWLLCCEVTTRVIGVPLETEFVKSGFMCGEGVEVHDVDAIVLLGGGIGAHPKCRAVELMQGSDRVRHAALLWKTEKNSGRTLKIYCTGGGVEFGTMQFLEDLGVPKDAVVFSEEPRNTAEEARWLKKSGVNKIALVTSAWHMKRARMLFERQGFEVVPAPTDFEMSYVAESNLSCRNFFPSADGVARNTVAMKEWVGLLGYGVLKVR